MPQAKPEFCFTTQQYDEWDPVYWEVVPNKTYTVEADQPIKIMETAAALYGKNGLKYTYGEVYNYVKDFDCGVFFSDTFLEANQDLVATLELRMYNPKDESQSFIIGEPYIFRASDITNGTILTEGDVTAKVPKDVLLSEGEELRLTINKLSESESDIVLSENETLTSFDVHVEGISEDNTVPVIITIPEVAEKGLNKGNLSLYHVENGETVAMTEVESVDELTEHNQFIYEPVDGTVTLAMATFSEIALVENTENKWNNEYDCTWYNTEDSVLKIANADQLAGFGAIVGGMAEGIKQDSFEGRTILLNADINIGDTTSNNGFVFYPIGYYNSEGTYEKTGTAITSGLKPFEGTFNGNGHTISNFYQNTWEMKGDNEFYDATEQNYRDGMGLFGMVMGATIKNLTIDNFTCDGEYTTTGVVATCADSVKGRSAVFENIAITNSNPRVYNIANGGIVGCGGWYSREYTDVEGKPIVFRNITVDNSNKITALWGSWDVACAGIMGRYYPDSNCGVTFENCHVAAQIDVFNDVCGNYQYYWYRYAGMMIDTVEKSTTDENGYTVPDMTGITAEDCTVHFGDWNNYYYCELVANSIASYTHDHQFSRLDEVDTGYISGNYVSDVSEKIAPNNTINIDLGETKKINALSITFRNNNEVRDWERRHFQVWGANSDDFSDKELITFQGTRTAATGNVWTMMFDDVKEYRYIVFSAYAVNHFNNAASPYGIRYFSGMQGSSVEYYDVPMFTWTENSEAKYEKKVEKVWQEIQVYTEQ